MKPSTNTRNNWHNSCWSEWVYFDIFFLTDSSLKHYTWTLNSLSQFKSRSSRLSCFIPPKTGFDRNLVWAPNFNKDFASSSASLLFNPHYELHLYHLKQIKPSFWFLQTYILSLWLISLSFISFHHRTLPESCKKHWCLYKLLRGSYVNVSGNVCIHLSLFVVFWPLIYLKNILKENLSSCFEKK